MASTYLTKAFSTATSQKKGTISFWFKTCKFTSTQGNFFSTYENDNNRTIMKLNGDSQFEFQARSGGNVDLRFDTNRKFRDTNAWYHIVIATDTTLGTAGDRCKIWVNGVQETSFATSTIPNQNVQPHYLYNNMTKIIGAYANGTANYFDGIMSHFHFTDGYVYAASDFGETDSTTGEWKIKTSPSVTYGNNGFFILKDGNSVTDQSGNSNNFTVGGGTLTKTEDCPSNVFATWNNLFPAGGSLTFNNGNTQLYNTGTAAYRTSVSTIGASTGKFYAEFKCEGDTFFTGVLDISDTKMGINDTTFGSSSNMTAYGYGIFNSTGNVSNNGSTVVSGYSAALSSGDILGVALDATNKKLYFAKNGTWQNSGDPTSGSTGTGAISLASGDRTWVFASSVNGTNISANFGNGYFGTTAVSSAGTNASGNGIFEYDVPTGFTALSTKGLNL